MALLSRPGSDPDGARREDRPAAGENQSLAAAARLDNAGARRILLAAEGGIMRVGFIGLGIMGASMASNVQKGGHALVVHDLRAEAAKPHIAAGAVWAATPREVAEASDVVLTSLPGPPEVEAVALGAEGLLAGVRAGEPHPDLSTNRPPYAGQRALAEVFTLGVKAGVEPIELWQAVRYGAGGRQRTFDRLADGFLRGKYDPPNFALRLAHKDVTLAVGLGREHRVPMRVANLVLEEMTEALNRGWGERDSRSPMLLQEERAGVQVRADDDAIRKVLEQDPPVA